MTEQDAGRADEAARDDEDGAEATDDAEDESGDDLSDTEDRGRANDQGDGDDQAAAREDGETVTDTVDETSVFGDDSTVAVDVDAAFEDEVDEVLVEHVEESDPESIAQELATLHVRVEGLEGELDAREDEVDDLTEKLKRKQADFQNYKKRMEKRREQEKQRATEDLVERLLDVRDNLLRALDQDGADVESIRSGIETTLSQFDRVLDEENVDVVDPEPGDEVDPHTHEVLMRVESDQPADTIAGVHRPGYVMADKVLQTAQVTVSDGDGGSDESAGGGDADGTGESDN